MTLRKKRQLLIRGMIGALAPMAIGYLVQLVWLMCLSFPLLVVWMVLVHRYWRCPYCGRPPGRIDGPITAYCPHCGKKLDCDERSDDRS